VLGQNRNTTENEGWSEKLTCLRAMVSCSWGLDDWFEVPLSIREGLCKHCYFKMGCGSTLWRTENDAFNVILVFFVSDACIYFFILFAMKIGKNSLLHPPEVQDGTRLNT